ncbi:hypothetical protein [Spiroplasma endosymbiont of Colias croceus]|uniref:hypothetical protein n=1 Tax=Spiroplasma endosymbiont of Colias croceus TaxID=3066310 RepID=UPI0030D05744
MAIKDPLMFITIEEFKNWKGFNKSLFDEVTTPDSEIRYAIEIASSNIDFLSGFTISKKWPEINPTKFTENIQTATTHYVNFLLGKGVEYARGQASIGQGGITYSQNNPEEPYYIVPQVFNYLKEINEYPTMQGFNLNVSPKQNWFKKFMGNGGEQNPWEIYLQTLNLKSSDPRTEITISHPKNIMGSVLYIDTRGIKSIDNLTTLELFTKYFSNDTMKLVDGKETQEKKVISAIGGNSLWEVNKDNPNFINSKDDKGISANDKRIIDVGTPTFETDSTNKVYVDTLLDKKQNKLTAGENIKIDEKTNTISATGGSADLSDYYKKEEVDKKLEDTKSQFPIAFSMNAIGQEIPTLETSNKTIVGAINENKINIDKKQDKENWKIIGKSLDNRTWEDFALSFNKYYRAFITWDKPPFNQTSVKLKIEFKSSSTHIGGDYMLVKGKIDNEDASLIIKLGTVNRKSQLIIIGENKQYGNIFSLEELQDTIKVDIKSKLQIRSGSLTTNEIEENIWDIELKNTPTPSIPQWKEVGTKININHIKYTFKSNTKYKIYYNFENQSSNKKFAFMCKEFLYGELNTDVQTLYWDKVNERIIISLQMQNDTIAIVSDPTRYGQLLKLEELQE